MATKVKKTSAKPQRNKRERGTSTVSAKNQITIPVDAMRAVGIESGDRVRIEVGRFGELMIVPEDQTRLERFDRAVGNFRGLYPPNYLEDLRRGEP